ncbi:hypothetical protein E2562_027560 [Oryza meyeriana var. granulata]|uniref:Uncharacterized protein n=1 Tax=Oryza meyeriana var. granulata TaxID=110450 RepID=A0A6G1EZP7_9ORYZ|nr:hypothetical protein E2562_027560 [Oryza meyeriana var. granulata]
MKNSNARTKEPGTDAHSSNRLLRPSSVLPFRGSVACPAALPPPLRNLQAVARSPSLVLPPLADDSVVRPWFLLQHARGSVVLPVRVAGGVLDGGGVGGVLERGGVDGSAMALTESEEGFRS